MTSPQHNVVLITGCSSGIGAATAALLAKDPHNVVYATARNVSALAALKDTGCVPLALDVTDEQSMRAAVQHIEAEHGAVDVLVNNAGYSQSGAVEAVSLERARAQFETNVFGAMRLIQLVLPAMRHKRAGKIVNVSSMGGKFTLPGGGYYHASKHALESLSDALRFELRGFGVDVIVIEPGLIRSGFSNAAVAQMEESEVDQVYGAFHVAIAKATKEGYEKGPLAKLAGTPDDVARVIDKSLRARRPRARYKVSASARVLMGQRKLLGDRAWDAFLRTSFPEPGRMDEPSPPQLPR
jgi:NAD(P)-dependent dehydrogenase (short-subunit alcohol dehydrogenase family)